MNGIPYPAAAATGPANFFTQRVRRLLSRLWRWIRPPRRVRPTLSGLLYLGILTALFFAALNSGNNLLYLLLSMLFATVAVSGIFSELPFRPLRARVELPAVVTVGEPFAFLSRFENPSRWRAAYLLTLEPGVLVKGRPLLQPERRWLAYLPTGKKGTPSQGSLWQQATPRRRGIYQIEEAYLTSRAPFGLFERKKRIPVGVSLCVLPAPVPLPLPPLHGPVLAGSQPLRRRGEGFDLRTLRAYQRGESARKIAWRASARAGTLLVRETEAETLRQVCVVLEPAAGKMAPAYLDRQAGAARFLCEEFLRRGYLVALRTPGEPPSSRFTSTPQELAQQLPALARWDGAVGKGPLSEPADGTTCVRVHPTGKVIWPMGL